MATQIGETGSFKKAAKGGKGSVIPDVEPEDPQRRLRARGPSPDEGRFTPMECDTYNGAESRDANLCSKDQRAAEEEQWESYYSELFDDDLSEQAEARLEDRGSKGNKVYHNRISGDDAGHYHSPDIRNKTGVMGWSIDTLKMIMTESTAPLLETLNDRDFKTIGGFLHTGEYHPALIASRGGQLPLKPHIAIPGMVIQYLEGLETKRDYEEAFIRSGHLYLLAHKLQLPKLKSLVLHKLRAGFPYLGQREAVQVADLVFSTIDRDWDKTYGPRYANEHPFLRKYEHEREPMRVFLLEYFADRLGSMTIDLDEDLHALLRKHPDVKAGIFARAAERLLDQLPDWYNDPEARRNPQWRWAICSPY